MDQENPDLVDLWGNRVYRTAGKRGRPPFQRTEENVCRVKMLLAAGWSTERIARCVVDPRTGKSISVPTLHRYFRNELAEREAERDRLEARRLERVWSKAEGGDTGAERLFSQLLDRNDMMGAKRRMADAQAKAPEKAAQPERLGKKEAALAAAKASAADTEWGADLDFGGKPVN